MTILFIANLSNSTISVILVKNNKLLRQWFPPAGPVVMGMEGLCNTNLVIWSVGENLLKKSENLEILIFQIVGEVVR